MPYFSIIIPLYNKSKYIEETLQSIINQDFLDFEIIVVDDGSTDNSVAIVKRFEDKRLRLYRQENKGVSVARNKGISYAKGTYIALLDADDIWYNNHLTALKLQIIQFPDAGLYCNNYEIYLDEKTKRNAKFNFSYKTDCLIVRDFFTASIINSVAWTSAVGFCKDKFNSVGGFDANLDTSEDLDLWIKLALRYKVSFNPNLTMSYRYYIHDSLTKKETNLIRLNFINSYKTEEAKNDGLKRYLDINRYALAIRCKTLKEFDIYKTAKKQILISNLNFKQKLLLYLPSNVLIGLKKIQATLIKNNIYISAFK
ncbi:glycosyltransferase [uncultured Winogradskyella sp.]|uniref:glycosyltransferase n=1 Tax=uncultured Winogradskyella sp. TaxID=395353 RepID=UPI0030D79775|tara:strand:- start:956 stop:1891 length:936 start_codon:yes stop_codon:yes gene_type:complete